MFFINLVNLPIVMLVAVILQLHNFDASFFIASLCSIVLSSNPFIAFSSFNYDTAIAID